MRDGDVVPASGGGHASPGMTRRNMLVGIGLTSVGVVAGCSTYGDEAAAPPPAAVAQQGGKGGGKGSKGGKRGKRGDAADQGIVAASDVPIGGGVVLADQQLVITQPSEGSFLGFSAVCTHAGCPVQDVSDGTINCPCHGSKFAVADGSVVDGPAPTPLAPVQLTVRGDAIALA
jgi:Rieske Fe-S protein